MTWVESSISWSWMWKFTLLLVGRVSSQRFASQRNLAAALGLRLRGRLLELVGLELYLLPLVLGREVDGLDRGQVGRARVARERRVLDELEVVRRVVRRLRDELDRRLGLLRLAQRADRVDLERDPRERGIGVLGRAQIALPVPGGVLEVALGRLREARVGRRGLRGGELVVVADELLERGLAAGGCPLLVAVDALLDRAVAAASAAALEGIQQAAGDATADAEEDEPPAHEQREAEIRHLHRPAALASKVEQHELGRRLATSPPPTPPAPRRPPPACRGSVRAGCSARRAHRSGPSR